MKLVQKGNKQLRIADDRVKDMLTAGFFEVDGSPITKFRGSWWDCDWGSWVLGYIWLPARAGTG